MVNVVIAGVFFLTFKCVVLPSITCKRTSPHKVSLAEEKDPGGQGVQIMICLIYMIW